MPDLFCSKNGPLGFLLSPSFRRTTRSSYHHLRIDNLSFFRYLYPCTDRRLLARTLALCVKGGCVAVRS